MPLAQQLVVEHSEKRATSMRTLSRMATIAPVKSAQRRGQACQQPASVINHGRLAGVDYGPGVCVAEHRRQALGRYQILAAVAVVEGQVALPIAIGAMPSSGRGCLAQPHDHQPG